MGIFCLENQNVTPNEGLSLFLFLIPNSGYLSQKEKLEKLNYFKSIDGISLKNGWQKITPDSHNDWISQRDDSFSKYISLGDKRDKDALVVFENFTLGLASGRDAWIYNFSKTKLKNNIMNSINFYNEEVHRYDKSKADSGGIDIDQFIQMDTNKISWNRNLKNDLAKSIRHSYEERGLVVATYRPFMKINSYFNKAFNAMLYQIPRIFPSSEESNLVISITGLGTTKEFSALITNAMPDLQLQANGQCFPLNLYERNEQLRSENDLFLETPTLAKYTRKDGISDAGLAHFQAAYPDTEISKEDLFYYIYGLLHSEEYKTKYADNLSKELPRIPCVKKAADFMAFSKAGRDLAHWHLNYETVAKYPVEFEGGKMAIDMLEDKDFYVTNMKFASKADKTTVIYNHKITMKGIPLEAYDYIVNGKSALEWVMERQGVSTHKDSGIVNDANDWAIETMGNARYPLELFQRMITVSLETMKIVKSLPKLDI